MMSATDELLAAARTYGAAAYAPPAVIADHGVGTWLYDLEGRAYLDLSGGIGVNALGHAHPEVVAAIAAQAGRMAHTSNGLYHAGAIDLSRRLAAMWPGPEAVQAFLCNSGSEAVEAALKLARRYFFDRGETERTAFIATHNSFHGRTMGALSVTGQPTYRKGFAPLLTDVEFVPFDDPVALTRQLTPHTAAVIVEPIQGNGGVRVPTPGYLAALRRACDTVGALLIFDEVQTGIGRTGHWFACEHDGVVPDILCLAKALGGGLPLGAMVANTDIMASLQPGVHGSTFGGNPVACAAGIATLRVIDRDGLLPRAQALGATWQQALKALPGVRQVRGRGLMVGLVCEQPARAVQQACMAAGLLTTVAGPDVLRLFPPLNVSEAELKEATVKLEQTLRTMTPPGAD